VAHNPLAIDLLRKDVKVIGSQVLTNKGCLIGQVTELMFEEETGKIAACQVSNQQGNVSQIKCDQVITYGKEIVLIDENPNRNANAGRSTKGSDRVYDAHAERRRAEDQAGGSGLNEKELLKKKIEEFGKSNSLLQKEEQVETISYPQDFNVFEQRQLQFLLGKMLDRDVQLDGGELLRAGEQITADSLSLVKSKNTLMQLTTHVVK
jgi:sporulation protein YlmC with PRC-barrel domain